MELCGGPGGGQGGALWRSGWSCVLTVFLSLPVFSFSPTDNKFATCSDDGTVRIWDFMRCHEERILRGQSALHTNTHTNMYTHTHWLLTNMSTSTRTGYTNAHTTPTNTSTHTHLKCTSHMLKCQHILVTHTLHTHIHTRYKHAHVTRTRICPQIRTFVVTHTF